MSAVYLSFQAQLMLADTAIAWGAQNVSQFEEGAYTGSISAMMVRDFQCRYAIIGHSERRALSHESDKSVDNRFIQLLNAGVTSVFCEGETDAEKQAGMAKTIVTRQMHAVLDALEREWLAEAIRLNAVFAYEPVWAIGTGLNATPEQAQHMHMLIRVA